MKEDIFESLVVSLFIVFFVCLIFSIYDTIGGRKARDKKTIERIKYYSKDFTEEQKQYVKNICGDDLNCQNKEVLLLNGIQTKL